MKTYRVFEGRTFFILVTLIFLPVVVSFMSRYHDPSYNDFEAFYHCAIRWSKGFPVYQSSDAFPFKYPPFSIIFFWPLAALNMDSARNLLGFLNLLACLSIPFALHGYFTGSYIPKNATQRKAFLLSTLAALMSSLRFIDNEFHSKNMNQLTYAFILWSFVFLKDNKNSLREFFGNFLFLLGGIFKLTPLLGLIPKLFDDKNKKTWLLFAILIVALLPNPVLWKDWLEQIKSTTGYFPFSDRSIYFQGFFAMSHRFLGAASRSNLSLLLSLPFFALLFYSTQKLKQSHSSQNQKDILSLLWILLSLLMNPLPWQHIYGFFWTLLPALFYASNNSKLRKYLWAICFFLALTPRSIIGSSAAYLLEVNQSIALVALLTLWVGSRVVHE